MQVTSFRETEGDKKKLFDSIDKLLHYIVIPDESLTVTVVQDSVIVYEKIFPRVSAINISPTLYTRIDNCHGAGNCCRVPFDLVYTQYDRSRIFSSDVAIFGVKSKEIFERNRDDLLKTLVEAEVYVNGSKTSSIFLRRNRVNQRLSGRESCPYLFVGEDRYYCGVHPFKPLHCWMPHMVFRRAQRDDKSESVSIGRMQYGRNHKFGCPVIFRETNNDHGLFETMNADYFQKQYRDDIDKIGWVSRSAQSLEMGSHNVASKIRDLFVAKESQMRALTQFESQVCISLR